MRILWKNHPSNPELNGTMEHVSRQFAEVAVGYKQAEYAPRPRYGTPEWTEERNAQQALITGPAQGDTVPGVEGVLWGVQDKNPLGGQQSLVRVIKKVGAETFYYSAPPDDAPPAIVRKFNSLTGEDGKARQAAIDAKQAQFEQHQKERLGMFGLIFGRS